MTSAERFDRRLEAGLDELADARLPDYLTDILATTRPMRQRPAWIFPGRWLPMTDITGRISLAPTVRRRSVVIFVAVVLIAVLGTIAIVGARPHRVPPPFGLAANGPIAYAQDGAIFLGDPLTRTSQRIYDGPVAAADPAPSRDGTRIAFISFPTEGDTLYAVEPDGSGLIQVTPPQPGTITFWDWGPDRSTLLFATGPTTDPRLFRADIDAKIITPVAEDLSIGSFALRPPDGRRMLVRAQGTAATPSWTGVGLIEMDLDGSHRTTIRPPDSTNLEEHDLAWPRYSPDGSRVAVQHWDWDASGAMQMHVMDADGSHDTILPMHGASFVGWPHWTADGKQLIVQRAFDRNGTFLDFTGSTLVLEAADGTGTPRDIGPVLSDTPGATHWEVSPDGTTLLIRWEGEPGQQVLVDIARDIIIPAPWASGSYPAWERQAP